MWTLNVLHNLQPQHRKHLARIGMEDNGLSLQASLNLRQFQENVLSKVDAFVTPSTGITAPEIPPEAFAAGELNAAQLGNIFRFSVYGNLIGVPGVAVPIGFDSRGLPMSVQFQTAHWKEDTMLRLAHATENLHAKTQKKPQIYFSILDEAKKQTN